MSRKRHKTIRRGLWPALALFSFLHAFGIADSLAEFRIGYGALNAVNSAVWIAKEAGLHQKNGFDARTIFFNGGARAIQATLAGELDATVVGATQIIDADGDD